MTVRKGDTILWTATKPGPWPSEGVSVVIRAREGVIRCRDGYVFTSEVDAIIRNGLVVGNNAEPVALTEPPSTFPDCGTPAAYKRHRNRSEQPCTACKAAHTAAGRAYKRRQAGAVA